MRSLTAAQDAQFRKGAFYAPVKVEIDRTGSGSWVDLTSLQGRNWVTSVNVEDSVDAPNATAAVTLAKKQSYYNLAPLVAGSQLNVGGTLVTIYRKIRISVAIMPAGVPPAAGDFVYLFKGRIFSIDWAGDEIKIEARDHVGDLLDSFIETISTIGSDTGVLAETVMQGLLTAQAPLLPAAVTLYSINGTSGTPFPGGDSPGWAIRTHPQDMMPIYSALQVLAQQIGWVLKYRWNASVGDFVLTWYDPVRSNTTSLRTFTSAQYFNITECSLHLGDIRNFVRVTYTDTAEVKQNVFATDAGSITAYGRKFMQIAEEATSQIDTSTEAQKMADGAISDLAVPVMTHSVEMPIFWAVEPGDIYTFAANGIHYDTDQKLSVFGFKHSFAKSATTTLSLRGKPSGGVRTWFEREMQQTRKEFGVTNLATNVDEANHVANGTFLQYTRG